MSTGVGRSRTDVEAERRKRPTRLLLRRPAPYAAAAAAAVAALAGLPATASAASSAAAPPPPATPSQAATKARVERGDGVPFFQERFGCRDDGAEWTAYAELVKYSRLRIFEKGEGPELAATLAYALAERTSNATEVLQCNVGIIAGYHLLARHMVATADDWRAYSLLQLALIWVFTLRNANRVPHEQAREWFTRSDHLIHEIRTLRRRLTRERARWIAQVPQVEPTFRQPGLRVAIVSICAYPKDHPLELRTLTPENRLLYAKRHGYALHVHRSHPMPDQGVHIQHAKLALMAEYLKTGWYDWVAWFDCDSIIMNMDKTLDSIIARYARRKQGRRRMSSPGAAHQLDPPYRRKLFARPASDQSPWEVHLEEDERTRPPELPEAIVAHVVHAGSCNSDEGCHGDTRVRVRADFRYKVTVETAMIDMEEVSERLGHITVGGHYMGDCNPSPENDYDCGFFECFSDELLPLEATSKGEILLEAHSLKTNDDCICDVDHSECYAAPLGAALRAAGQNSSGVSCGMFVRFTLTPVESAVVALPRGVAEEIEPPTGAASVSPEHSWRDPHVAAAAAGALQDLVAYLAHEGSCNTAEGCRASARVQVDPHTKYVVQVTTALIDMEDDAEKLASVRIGGLDLGECNPSPESDYSCSYFDCFQDVDVPTEASSIGSVLVEVHSVRTNNDCHCSPELDTCYNTAQAILLEATGQGVAPPSHGLFVKVVLSPKVTETPGAKSELAVAALAVAAMPPAATASGGQELVAYVSHAGSCNTVTGCRASTLVRVDPKRRYRVSVATALIDMEDDSERLAGVSIAGRKLGECNPSPGSDFDCGWFECFTDEDVELPQSGEIALEAHAVRTSDDCRCSLEEGACYPALLADMYRAMGENVTDASYGMFVRFTLAPVEEVEAEAFDEAQEEGLWRPASPVDTNMAQEPHEPLEDEVIEAYVGHIGSCNSDEGCHASSTVLVNRHVQYEVSVTTALVDMAEPSEKLASVSVGGHEFGECNPAPGDDFDCGFADCAIGELLPRAVTAEGQVELRAHAVRTSADCHCNRLLGSCYSAVQAAMGEASGEDPTTDPRYGMFVRFTLTPVEQQDAPIELPPWARLRRRGAECVGGDVLLATDLEPLECLALCREVPDCSLVTVGTQRKAGRCFWQLGPCTEFEEDFYDVYDVTGDAGEADDDGRALAASSEGALGDEGVVDEAMAGAEDSNDEQEDEADLLITEEGWGLSSANWLIRRSDWSISFLENAFRLCQEEMPLFGDQDAMIHLLLNERALLSRRGTSVDPHAVIIPQHEINAYDALNAFYMEADAYSQGDLLITFPGCKEAGACNPLFRLAAAHGRGDGPREPQQSWPYLRVFGPPDAAAAAFETARHR